MFLDRSFVHQEAYAANPNDLYSLDVQYKLYYQFIKHHFGIKEMPSFPEGIKILLHLDDHSSQKHKSKLEEFVKDLTRILGRSDIQFSISYVNSGSNDRIQACDLLMGAAGSHGNKMHDIRIDGRRGMTGKQKVRHDLCKHVYNHLRNLSCSERNTKAFNWFESTGGSSQERFTHKVRIWKFVPKKYFKDKGWENDHLAKDGSYVGPDIDTSKVIALSERDDLLPD
jgi:hypothetical protein